ESRAADPRSPARGGSDRSRRAHVGARVGCAPGAPGTLYRRRPAGVSDGPRATEPKTGDGPAEDHEEGAIAEETAVPPGRLGAALSGIARVLALSRTVVIFQGHGEVYKQSLPQMTRFSRVFSLGLHRQVKKIPIFTPPLPSTGDSSRCRLDR